MYLNQTSRARLILVLLYLAITSGLTAQSISGKILDENHRPVPFANLLVRETGEGASADHTGSYHLTIMPGTYTIVVSSVGYESRTFVVIVPDEPLSKDFQIHSSSVQLEQIEVRARKRDEAYDIMKKASDRKDELLRQVTASRSKIYLRASEVVGEKEKKRRAPEPEADDGADGDPNIHDAIARERRKEEERLSRINMVEMKLTLNYQYPDRYKEERTAYKAYGRRDGLFIPLFHETDFNFYYNLVDLRGIAEIPMISPLSRTAILSYKFKLEEVLRESSGIVYKIRVTPRKSGDATARGFVFINDSTWSINRLELSLHKGSLKFFDDFTIKQEYKEIAKDVWIPFHQEFLYETKAGGRLFKGHTVLHYEEVDLHATFPEKFFGNEVSVTTKEAYERDSTFWKAARSTPLSEDEHKMVRYRDSLEAVRTSKKYLDSIQARYNRVTVGEVLYHGVGFRNETKNNHIFVGSLLELIGFEVIGGLRLGPHANYFKRYKDNRWFYTMGSLNVGLKNADVQGGGSFRGRYNPFSQGEAGVRFGREFYSINSFDAYLNQLRISNYIVRDYIDLYHHVELVNGFYFTTDLGYSTRRSVDGYDPTSVLNEVIDQVDPLSFETYDALLSRVKLAYVYKQRYMREPSQKIILGSVYPTVFFSHQRGWNGLLGSDTDFDYIDFGLDHKLLLGTLGSSRYTLTAGKFINTRRLPYVDLKRFRQSDPYLLSDPMHSFQLLDTSLNTTDWFIEGHYLHHFNGAMINNIPLIKKLRLRTVAGAGFMWIRQSSYRYEEIFGGIERIFKLGPRRRLKLGLYGVISQSNFLPPQADWKISFDIIDTWKRNWSY